MGRFFGKRPDRTAEIARSISSDLEPGEIVLAGVQVQRPGTTASGMSGAVDGAVTGALGTAISFRDDDGKTVSEWQQAAGAAGAATEKLTKAIWLILALTTQRLVLMRRSRLTGKPAGVLAAWPVDQIAAIRVPRNGDFIHVDLDGTTLTLELPQAHKFLPDVYRRLPELLARARENPT